MFPGMNASFRALLPGCLLLCLSACGGASSSTLPPPAYALSLSYPAVPTLTVGSAITPLTPTVGHATPGAATTYAVNAGALPAGLTLNADGSISGTPTVTGDFSATIRATSGSAFADAVITGTVLDSLYVFYDFPVFVVGKAVSGLAAIETQPRIVNAAADLPITFAVTAGTLPPGLALNANDGSLSGTPTAAGDYRVTFTASNGGGQASETKTLQVTLVDIGATASSVSFVDPGVDTLRPAASTADFYLDAVHGDDTATGTSATTAWKTLARLHQQVLQPGNVVHLARGSVWLNQHLLLDNGSAGSAAAPVVFEAYGSGDLPTIAHPRALWDSSQPFDGVFVSAGSSYITVLDLRVQDTDGASGFTMTQDTDHIVFGGNEILTAGSGISVAGTHQKILSCYLHDISANGPGSGIGIGFVGSDLEFGWNRITNCRVMTEDGIPVDGGAFEYYGRMVDEQGHETYDISDNIRIHHNLISNCLDFMEAYGNMTNLVIDYNLYINGETEALEFHLDDCEHATWTHECTYRARIENNTFVPRQDSDPGGWGIVGQLVDFNHLPDPAKSSLALRNNIFVTNYKVLSHNSLGASFTHDHNLYQLLDGGILGENWSADATDRTGDPKFVDAASGNYQPGSGSPAINAGAAALYPMDLLGAPVPTGSAPDIGAYEWQ